MNLIIEASFLGVKNESSWYGWYFMFNSEYGDFWIQKVDYKSTWNRRKKQCDLTFKR